ncbi:unnamed protein product [Danaus chrysippus]|uniref:(African queen) hypothetical protein n=1 Tax=Danaus chrysippus TaxID=151541 RepID=A0A8J2R578_9NEOP|nr:unnamed protein product [Danaus chrysippus]
MNYLLREPKQHTNNTHGSAEETRGNVGGIGGKALCGDDQDYHTHRLNILTVHYTQCLTPDVSVTWW